MKTQIRSGVFETNSSSCHSLVVKKENEYYTQEEIGRGFWYHDGKIHLYDFNMRYDRSPFKMLCSFRDKWMYCLCALTDKYGDEKWDELEAILKEYIPDIKVIVPCYEVNWFEKKTENAEDELNDKLNELEEVLSNHGVEKELNYWEDKYGDFRYDYPYSGYAEDYGMLGAFLKKNDISLREFLTNKKYIIICDGDEYCIWSDIKSSGLIDFSKIEYEYPKE